MKVCVYARESSDDTGKAPSINTQIEIGMAWCEKNKHDLVNIYSDNGYSGGVWRRPSWNQTVKDARRHLFQIVWVWNQDRIARDTEQFLWFYRNLKDSSVKVYSETEGFINMETAGDRIKHTSLAMASETFRLITSEKVKRAYEHQRLQAEKSGKQLKWGRPRLDLDVNKIMSLRQQGMGYRAISKEIGVSYQTIRRIVLQKPPAEDEAVFRGEQDTKK